MKVGDKMVVGGDTRTIKTVSPDGNTVTFESKSLYQPGDILIATARPETLATKSAARPQYLIKVIEANGLDITSAVFLYIGNTDGSGSQSSYVGVCAITNASYTVRKIAATATLDAFMARS